MKINTCNPYYITHFVYISAFVLVNHSRRHDAQCSGQHT